MVTLHLKRKGVSLCLNLVYLMQQHGFYSFAQEMIGIRVIKWKIKLALIIISEYSFQFIGYFSKCLVEAVPLMKYTLTSYNLKNSIMSSGILLELHNAWDSVCWPKKRVCVNFWCHMNLLMQYTQGFICSHITQFVLSFLKIVFASKCLLRYSYKFQSAFYIYPWSLRLWKYKFVIFANIYLGKN